GGGGAGGAVPHRTYPGVAAPWGSPGIYTVRLSADGRNVERQIKGKVDPRGKVTPGIQTIFTLTTQMGDNARPACAAYKEARALADKVKTRTQSAANDALLKQLDEIAAPESGAAPGGGGGGRAGRGGRGGRGGGTAAEVPAEAGAGGRNGGGAEQV